MSVCMHTKQNVKLKIIFGFKSRYLSANRISHFLFLHLRLPHSPALTVFFSSLLSLKVQHTTTTVFDSPVYTR